MRQPLLIASQLSPFSGSLHAVTCRARAGLRRGSSAGAGTPSRAATGCPRTSRAKTSPGQRHHISGRAGVVVSLTTLFSHCLNEGTWEE